MDLSHLTISAGSSLKEAIHQININSQGFVCVLSADGGLEGTITDGDIRRALLKGFDLSVPCHKVMNSNPSTLPQDFSKEEALQIFKEKKIRNLPVLNNNQKLVSVVSLNELLEGSVSTNSQKTAVIMAGGEGKRLRPFTENIPKPMLEINGKPILEQIINQLKGFGFEKFYISVNYLSEVIMDHFKDGESFGVDIEYLEEKEKLGTAGALSMLPQDFKGPLLVLNGDVVSDINFQQFFEYHDDNKADMTMAASTFKFQIPFGVLSLDGERIRGVEEKPTKSYLCNAGIYMLSDKLVKKVPANTKFDMTELLNQAVSEQDVVKVFPLHECWLDVGRKEDLLKAKESK